MPVLSGTANAGRRLRCGRIARGRQRLRRPRATGRAGADRSGRRSSAWPTATPASSCPATLLVAGLAWALSGDPVRALAVVVVATPCPLILAAPIALVSGLSRAARAGVIVKGAGAIETLGAGAHGPLRQDRHADRRRPEVREILPTPAGFDAAELLRFAASVDQMSAHVLGEALVRAAGDAASR